MARWQVPFKRKALRAIPRVVDNTEAMAIKQSNLNESHKPIRRSDMPGGQGTFSPYSNQNFK
jgi:hypothetical protein